MTTTEKQRERETAVIRAPHDGSEVGVVALAGPEEVRGALDANVAAARACRELPAYSRPRWRAAPRLRSSRRLRIRSPRCGWEISSKHLATLQARSTSSRVTSKSRRS